jgi:hypothetical protein
MGNSTLYGVVTPSDELCGQRSLTLPVSMISPPFSRAGDLNIITLVEDGPRPNPNANLE